MFGVYIFSDKQALFSTCFWRIIHEARQSNYLSIWPYGETLRLPSSSEISLHVAFVLLHINLKFDISRVRENMGHFVAVEEFFPLTATPV